MKEFGIHHISSRFRSAVSNNGFPQYGFRFLTGIFLSTLFLPAASFARTAEKASVIAAADSVIEKEVSTFGEGSPGCAVGVGLDGEPIYKRAFGLAEIEQIG